MVEDEIKKVRYWCLIYSRSAFNGHYARYRGLKRGFEGKVANKNNYDEVKSDEEFEEYVKEKKIIKS